MIRLGNTGLTLCLWGEHRRMGHDEILALLRPCASDPSVLMELRALVHDRTGMAGMETLDEDRLLAGIASMVQSGELLLFGTPVRATARSASGEQANRRETVAAPPPKRTAAARTVAPPPPPDPPVIPPTVDRPALVAAMRSAADSGVPFCDT
jgi:hypothetical protein